jgi:uncharacterized protein (TIGR03437 family)
MRLAPAVLLALIMSWSTFGQTYTINTVAGNGTPGFSGDYGPATSAQLHGPFGVAVDSAGNLYISDSGNNVVRKVANSVITTVAGNPTNPTSGYSGNGGPPTTAQLDAPYGVAVDSAGNLYIADSSNNVVREVANGVINTVAGNGTLGYTGDHGAATSAELDTPDGVAVDSTGNLYIADFTNSVIRKVSNGVITTFAGNNTYAYGGDGNSATNAELFQPVGVAVDSAGNVYIADTYNSRIRKVSNGIITTVAGDGTSGYNGDGNPPTAFELNGPTGVAVDSAGNIYIADTGNNRIRKVSNGAITTIAGGNTPGYAGDGSPAAIALLNSPIGVAVDSAGNVYVTDFGNNRVRVLTLSSCTYALGTISLVAPGAGGYFSVTIQTGAGCPWTVSGLPAWMAVSGGSSGAGPASVTLAAFPNNSGAPLSATISVAGISVKVTQPAATTAPLPPILAVTNAASYATGAVSPVSPGEMVTIFGAGIGPATPAYATLDPATGKLATTIGGVQVLFNGVAAPMIYAGINQISAVVPYEMAPVANPWVWIKFAGQTSNAFPLTTVATLPGLFTQNASGSGPGAILNQDGITVNTPGHPAAKGSVVTVYMTGEGQTNPAGVTGAITTATLPPPQVTPTPASLPIAVTINGQPATYQYAGEAPGFVAGTMQLNVQIPSNAPSGALPIVVSIGGNSSQNGVTVSVQ